MNSIGPRIAAGLAAAALALAAAATLAQLTSLAGSPPQSDQPNVTFTHDIAPIIFHNCAGCHHPGGAGPFPLLSYQDVRSHARQIAEVTRSRFMPPWQPEPGKLKFDGERRLSDEQITLLQKWVEGGVLEGPRGELPSQPRFVEGWQLGKPDLVLRAQKPFRLPAAGGDTYWNFVLPIPIDRTRWVKAVEIRPGDKRVVHHANMLVDRLGRAREMEAEPGAGFGGMET
ncbi:MAG TPA: cytochrome c, partial [Terriglobales bacterium]|nr:cytochrome c [Terriglobales bacterium]